ncbi:E3 ubiquitin-protein ligase [Hirschfeldia incana]|nr:E3 ubiquitin-protein ligase [Hirschfeldia incana]
METDSPLFGSFPPTSIDSLIERLAFAGVPKERCSKHGLVEFVRANPSKISEIVSALLPTDEDVKAGLKEAKERDRSRKSAVSPSMKGRFRESMSWLQWLMFEDDPGVSLSNLAELNVDQRGVCGSVWGHNDIAYKCRTCENDPTCAICVPCFENGDHRLHDYSIIYTGGGCCDCGDETAWKREGFCSKHKGSEQIQPLPENIANSVGPVLDALFACWNEKLVSAESIAQKDARSSEDAPLVLQKMSNELTFVVVEMLLEFSQSTESLLSFVSRRIISSTGLLDSLVKAERFLDQDVMKKLHDLFLKLIADPVFKSEFAKAFASYYPVVISEAVKLGTDNAFKKYPLLSTFSVQILTVPTLTPFLVKERNFLAMLLGCLNDIFVSCSGEDGVLQATKWERMSEISDRVIADLKFVTSHAVVSKYATHEHRELSRSWLLLLTFAQGMNPIKRETGIHIEDDNEYMHLFFILGHSVAVIHSLLVTGTYSTASDEEIENERTTKAGLDKCDGDGERYAKVGRLSHGDSVCTSMVSSSSFDSSIDSEVNKIDPFRARLPSSAIWLIRECLKVLETCLEDDEGISKFLCKLFSPSGSNFLGSTMSWPKRDFSKVEIRRSLSSALASSSRDPSTGLSPLCGDIQTNLSLDNVDGSSGEVQTDVKADSRRVSCNSSDPNEPRVHILGLSDWPDIQYSVSSQPISVHLPLHRLLSLLLQQALERCYGESALHHGVNVSHEIPQADFFSYVIGDFHPCGLSALVMEHVLRVRVFCAQVIAGMWKKNGDSALVSSEWYRSVRWSEQGLELDLFLLQFCGALAPADSYVNKILDRFGLSSYLSLNLDMTNEYEAVLVQEMLALLMQILQERRFCGLSTAESLRREIIFKLATGDFTHSQLVKSLPRDLSKSDELQEVLDDVSVYCNPSGMNQGKYSLRSSCWKELDLYHPRWHSRELQSAEERFSRYCGVSAVTTQLPKWRMIYPPLKGLSRIGTCKATFQIICSALYYALQSGTSVKSRAREGVLISALHLLSLSLDICTQQKESNIQACCVEDSIPILELAGLEIIGINQGTGKESLLSLLVSLMRTRKDDGLHQFPEAGSCNISSWIGNLLKKFSAIDSVCMNLLQSLAPEVVGHSGFDKSTSGSASDDKRKAKARERQAAILAKMKAEQSKFLSTLSSSMDDEDPRSETETSDSVMEKDSEIAIREVCSFCHDPDSRDPVSFLIFLQKSKLLSFVDRGPPSWDQCPQSEKKIPMDGAPDLQRTNVSSDSLRMIPHVLQLSDDATSESATDSVLEALTARLIGNVQKEKRSSDGRGKDESNLESLEIAMYQTVRKKIENMINQSRTPVQHRQPDSGSGSERSSFGVLSTLHRFPDRSKQTSRYLDVSSDGFHPADCDGVYLSSCGHAVHQSCLERYLSSLKERSERRNVFEGAHIVDLVQGEFLCPACRRLANSVLPACPGDLCSVSTLQESLNVTTLSDDQMPSLWLSEALCLLQSAADVIEDGDSLKTVSQHGDEPRRKDLQSISNKLLNFYFSKRQERPPGSSWQPQSIIMWDTLKYSLISMEIVTRCGKNSMLPVYCIDSLYEEFKTSKGIALSVLLRVVQSTRTKNALHVRQRFMGMKHLAESICSGISSSSGSEGTAGSWKNINLLWSRASDPVLAHDPFSSLMWALFCLPSPFITCEESLLSLVHIFYSVSVIQTVITYCAGRLCYTSELDFKENLLSDISIALRESGGWEYFRSNNMDLSRDIKETIRKYSLPFLRRCALLWRLLRTTPGKFHEEVHMSDVPSDSNSGYMDFMYSPQSELNHVLELEKMFKISPIDTTINDELLWSSSQTWLRHFQMEYRVNRVKGPLCVTPLVPFQLMKLPNLYQDLLQRYIKKPCSNCKKVIEEPALCLLCGRLCSPIWRPCCRESGCQTHAVTCGAGTGVYLLIRRTTILLQRFARQSPWPSPYLDTFGEEDMDMIRGKPLYLNEERYAALTYMVGSHGLDHSSKVLNQTTIGAFLT